MTHKFPGTVLNLLAILSFSLLLAGCAGNRKVAYLQNITDTTIQAVLHDLEPVLQKNDLISISVTSINQEAAQVFNVMNNNAVEGTNSSNSNNGYSNQVFGYLINQDGFIEFPILGRFKAAGISKKLLAENIRRSLVSEKLLKDPLVNIRYLNYKVTVLGEVGKPMVINVPNEKITLFEALGLAGDITIFGKKNNVLLIREEGDRKTVKRIDLNSPALLQSPYYYLQSNDVVYIEPNKARISATSTTRQWLPIVISGLTLVVVAVDRFIQ